jgi:hypothetical protein
VSTYPGANRTAQWFSSKYSSATFDPNCVVWHSTETLGWPGYGGGAMAPNYTVLPDLANKRVLWRAHFEDEESSRALVNLSGGVETNTANAIQVEMIGTCNPAWAKEWPGTSKKGGRDYLYLPAAPDWFLDGIAEFMAYLHRRHGIRLASPGLTWVAYPGSANPAKWDRMSFAQWRGFYGHCGHQHVPENTHGDPGNFPIQRALDKAAALVAGKTSSGTTTPVSVPQEDDIMAITDADAQKIANALASLAIPNHDPNPGDKVPPASYAAKSYWVMANWRAADLQNSMAMVRKTLADIAGKVGVDIDEQALAAELAASLAPAVREAVLAAGQPDAVADAVVQRLGAALASPAS